MSTLGLSVLVAGTLVAAAEPVGAAVITVNTTFDELNSDGDCSLREAVEAANTNTVVDACPAGSDDDTIEVPAGSYVLTIPGASEFWNQTGSIDIGTRNSSDSVHIVGSGASSTIIDGAGLDRVLVFVGDNVPATHSLSGVTVTNGLVSGAGGGIYTIMVSLTIDDSVVSGNTVEWAGSPDFVPGGGGIATIGGGVLTLNGSLVSGNETPGSGGGIHAFTDPLVLNGSSVVGNVAGGHGGGVYQDFRAGSPITLASSLVAGNLANGVGGGLSCANCVVTNSELSGNVARALFGFGIGGEVPGGGGISGTATVDGSYIHDNEAESGDGGGLNCWACSISNSRIGENAAGENGGGASGAIQITDSTVSDNVAGNNGGGLAGFVDVERSTITRNNASGTSSSPFEPGPGWGGGLFVAGTITNSTISGNEALRGSGGISGYPYIVDNNLPTEHLVPLRISNSTVAFNSPDGVGNVGHIHLQMASELAHTIVAQNATEDCLSGMPPTSLGYNLVGDDSCGLSGPGDLPNTDPLLDALTENGGPTETHALAADSPAIDAGTSDCAPAATDQRGVARPQGAGCDIGAFEAEYVQPDALVRRKTDAAFKGNDIYNLLAIGQTLTTSIAPGDTAAFKVRVENDGDVIDDVTVRALPSAGSFTVRYSIGYYNVTSLVTGAGFTYTDLAPGASRDLTVWITANADATSGSVGFAHVVLRSGLDASRLDAVRARARVA